MGKQKNNGNRVRPRRTANQRIQKKKGCCGCLVTALIIFLVFLGAGAGVGYYFGDKYAKEYLDMSLSECFDILKDLRSAEEKDIVKKPFTASEKSGFENEIKRQLLLKDSVEIEYGDLLDSLMQGIGIGEKGASSSPLLMNALIETGMLTSDEAESGGNDAIMDFIATLYGNPDNIDLDRLGDYNDAAKGEYMLAIKDTQVASFISGSLAKVLESDALASTLNPLKGVLGDIDLTQIIKLNQVIFDSVGSGESAVPHIVFTLSIEIRTVAIKIVEKQINGIPEFVFKWLLPERLYLTADLALTKDEGADRLNIRINNMTNEKMNKLFNAVGKASAIGGGETVDIKKTISESTDEFLTPVVNTILDYGNTDSAKDGKFQIDLFETVISLADFNKDKTGDDRLTSSDIYYALRYALTSSFEEAIWRDFDDDRYTWQNIYKTPAGELVYRPDGAVVGSGEVLVDYKQLLMDEFETKLSLNLPKNSKDERDFDELMKYFGMGVDDDDTAEYNFTDLLNAGGLKGLAEQELEKIKVVITDQMLAAMLAGQVDTLVGGGEDGLGSMMPEVVQVAITTDKIDGVEHTFMEAGLKVSIASAFESAGGFAEVFKDLLPKDVMISFKMDITLKIDAADYVKTKIYYNDLDEDEVSEFLAILSKLGIELGVDDIVGQINDPVRDAIESMADSIPGLEFKKSAVTLPDIFTLTVDQVINKDEVLKYEYNGEQREFDAAALQSVIKGLYGDYEPDVNKRPADSYSGFLENIIEKYYLKGLTADPAKAVEDEEDPSNNVVLVETFDDLTQAFSLDEFSADKIDTEKLMHTSQTIDLLRPKMTDSELACLIKSLLGSDMEDFNKIVEFAITEKNGSSGTGQDDFSIEMTVEIELSALFGDSSEDGGGNSDFTKFIDITELYIVVAVDLGSTVTPEGGAPDDEYYATSIQINTMNGLQMTQLQALANHFAGEGGFDLNEKAVEIGRQIYNQLSEFKEDMGDTLIFEEGGVKIASIFELLASLQDVKPDAEDLRGALQGVYENDDALEDNSPHNFVTDEIIDRRITSDAIGTEEVTEFLLGTNNMPDNRFGKLMVDKVDIDDPRLMNVALPHLVMDTDGMELMQFKVYSSARADANTNPFADYGTTNYDANKNYLEFVFKLSNFVENGGEYEGIISRGVTIYITVVISQTFDTVNSKNVYEALMINNEAYIRINSLTYAQQLVLFDVAQVDTEMISNQLNNCLEVFKGSFFDNIQYHCGTENGADIGEVEFTKFKVYP